MSLTIAENQSELIGHTPLLKIPSLSKRSGCNIYLKCEQYNPGGSIKDRAALSMVQSAIASGDLKPGMTIIEGTAGNTGIGLAVVGRALNYKVLVVMPKGQTKEKERMVQLHGAKLNLVDPCPFKNQNHFYHTARRIAEESPEQYWWANQFENTANGDAHYRTTGPELWQQCGGRIDAFVSAAGTGGTIGGTSKFLKEKDPQICTVLVDPAGSGLKSFHETGEFKSKGSSFTEGIGIMRLTANFAMANVDQALSFPDQDIVTLAHYVQKEDGILLGSSSALNLCASYFKALQMGEGKTVVSFACDLGERSFSKLYNPEFLEGRGIDLNQSIDDLQSSWSM